MTQVPIFISVVSSRVAHLTHLAAELPEARVHSVSDTEDLLRMKPPFPAVVVLYADTYEPPLEQVLEVIAQRRQLEHTYWIGVGTSWLAGLDAVVSPLDPVGLVAQIQAFLRRREQLQEIEKRREVVEATLAAFHSEEQAREQFVHMLVHDMKNPISAILGLLDLAIEDENMSAETSDFLLSASDEAQHLLQLSVNLLDVGKMQAGKMHLRREWLYGKVIEEIFEKSKKDVGMGLNDRQLMHKITPNMKPVFADPEILRRVLTNLLSNAYKHTKSGGKIQFRVRSKENHLEFALADNGEGIPPEDLELIFQRFEQSKMTSHTRLDTGMGLAFTKMAIEEHGGRIWVESVYGQGSVFFFTLPYQVQEEEEEEDFAELLV